MNGFREPSFYAIDGKAAYSVVRRGPSQAEVLPILAEE
jgi:hypothetical protein